MLLLLKSNFNELRLDILDKELLNIFEPFSSIEFSANYKFKLYNFLRLPKELPR